MGRPPELTLDDLDRLPEMLAEFALFERQEAPGEPAPALPRRVAVDLTAALDDDRPRLPVRLSAVAPRRDGTLQEVEIRLVGFTRRPGSWNRGRPTCDLLWAEFEIG